MKLLTLILVLLESSLSCSPPQQYPLHLTRSLQDGPPVPGLNWQPIRLTLDYPENLPSDLLSQFFPRAISWYQNTLQLVQNDSITISSSTCAGIQVPSKYLNTSLYTDVVILINYTDSEEIQTWAVPCEINEDLSMRPVLGMISLQGSFTSMTWEQKFSLVVHQIAHVLAYDSHLIPYFLSDIGEKYGINQVIGYTTRRNSQINFIKTPEVLKYARLGFQCNSLYGLDTEASFQERASAIHWEKRIMFNDFMTAGWNKTYIVFSTISLALFVDSGWYQVDYNYGSDITWGAQEGCAFILNECIQDEQAQFPEFCNISTPITLCDHTHTYKGICSLSLLNSPIPAQYQYFDSPYSGGSDSLTDYCPFIEPMTTGSCQGIGINSTDINENEYGESVCESCRCLEGTYVNQLANISVHFHAGCHQVACEGDIAVVYVGQEVIFCEPSGGPVTIRGYNGYLTCPDSNILCKNLPCPFACHGRGLCINGKCQCSQGSSGTYCENLSFFFTFYSILLILTN